MKKYRGLIFDFNGTLYFDSDKHERAWREFALDFRGREITDEEFAANFHGRPARSILHYLAGEELEPDETDRLIQEKEAVYRDYCLADKESFCLAPGAITLLDKLKSQNFPMTIATALEMVNISFFIHQFELGRWFDTGKIVFDDGTFPGKPAPDIYLKAAGNLNLAPADCIVVEDAKSGVQSAQAAGIGFVIGMVPESAKELADTDLVLRDFHEFPVDWLDFS
jgi:HAD superfamily hydrolase (TIGR01509 family)